MVHDILPVDLKAQLDSGRDYFLLDVRNVPEWEIAQISGAHLIPLPELSSRLGELPFDRDIVVFCKAGVRSLKAISILEDFGYERVFNLSGGIDLWSLEVDLSLARY